MVASGFGPPTGISTMETDVEIDGVAAGAAEDAAATPGALAGARVAQPATPVKTGKTVRRTASARIMASIVPRVPPSPGVIRRD
jgi:hypothetical protein